MSEGIGRRARKGERRGEGRKAVRRESVAKIRQKDGALCASMKNDDAYHTRPRERERVERRANLRVTALILVKARDLGIQVSAEANLMKR